MKSKRTFTTEVKLQILQEQEKGITVKEICRNHGISPATFHNWKNKYGGLTKSELYRLKSLEKENSRLKKLVANQALDLDILKDLVEKKF